jgi:ketosteroid isomerase-like protein
MNRRLKFNAPVIWVLLLVISMPFGYGQSGGDVPAEQEVRGMEQQWRQAWLAVDFAALDRILADDFMAVPYVGIVSTKAEVMADLRRGVFQHSRMDHSEMSVRVYGATAVVIGRTINEGHRGDRDLGGQFRYTRVYVKRNGQWQVVSAQYTRIVRSH